MTEVDREAIASSSCGCSAPLAATRPATNEPCSHDAARRGQALPWRSGLCSISLQSASRYALYIILCCLALLPLLWASVPPLVDYPNNLARMGILANFGPSALHQNYVAAWRLLPNLAMDIAVPPLVTIMPLEIAGRMFIAATMVLLVAGTAALHRALFEKVGLWPLCSLLFLYNSVLLWGFLNYLFGLGVALLAFAGWVWSARWRPLPRTIVFAGVASLLFVLHLFAFGLYGLLVASFELGSLVRTRAAAPVLAHCTISLAQFVPAIFLWVWCTGNGGPQYWAYGGFSGKLSAIMAPTSFSNPPSAFDAAVFGGIVLFCYLAWRERIVMVVPEMRLPLIAMLIATAVMPQWASGSWGADLRLPVALAFIAIASSRPVAWRRQTIVLVSMAVVAVMCIRVWSISLAWHDMDCRFNEFRSALSSVPAGARLFAVQSYMPDEAEKFRRVPIIFQKRGINAFWHLDALAVMDRGAFVPSLFTVWSPIRPAPRDAGMSRIVGGLLSPGELAQFSKPTGQQFRVLPRNPLGELPCCLDWPRLYDFVIWIDFGRPPASVPKHLMRWAGGSFFHIYRIIPGSG